MAQLSSSSRRHDPGAWIGTEGGSLTFQAVNLHLNVVTNSVTMAHRQLALDDNLRPILHPWWTTWSRQCVTHSPQTHTNPVGCCCTDSWTGWNNYALALVPTNSEWAELLVVEPANGWLSFGCDATRLTSWGGWRFYNIPGWANEHLVLQRISSNFSGGVLLPLHSSQSA